jgi:hypothetical protein
MSADLRALLHSGWLSLAIAGCSYSEESVPFPTPSVAAFATDAYPVLLGDCGFPDCHGGPERFFQVYGPGRARLAPLEDPFAPPTEQEIEYSYQRARSMLAGPDGVARSLLLRKPLAVSAGGAMHEGDDAWGKPVYGSSNEPNFRKLVEWALRTVEPDAGRP